MTGSHAWEEEARQEAERTDKWVATEEKGPLIQSPSAWERFRTPQQAMNSYMAAMYALGDVSGKRVLDVGCGDGWLSVILAKLGASVVAFDVSPVAVERAKARAVANGVAGQVQSDAVSAYDLPYADASFDCAIGESILHHLQHKERFSSELARVLKPGGLAVFSEPFGNVMWLESMRRYIPVASASPDDPDEWKHQFKYSDMEPFRALFETRIQEFHLLSRLDRLFHADGVVKALNRVDSFLLSTLPFLRPYARAAMIELRKR